MVHVAHDSFCVLVLTLLHSLCIHQPSHAASPLTAYSLSAALHPVCHATPAFYHGLSALHPVACIHTSLSVTLFLIFVGRLYFQDG